MLEQYPMVGAERCHRTSPPGRQAVRVQGDAQALRQAIVVQRRHLALQVALEQAHLLHMVEQALAQRGRPGRCTPQQDRLADTRLEQLDPLRHCRLREPQRLRRALEAGLLDDCGKRRQQFVIEHQFS